MTVTQTLTRFNFKKVKMLEVTQNQKNGNLLTFVKFACPDSFENVTMLYFGDQEKSELEKYISKDVDVYLRSGNRGFTVNSIQLSR